MRIERFDLGAYEKARGAQRAAMAGQVDRVCRHTGFIMLEGHGVPTDVIDGVWERAAAFFALPQAEKARVAPPRPGDPYGWLGPNSEALARSRGDETPPDLKESFNGGPGTVPDGLREPDALAFCYAPTPWPDLPGFRSAWLDYYAQMERLAERVMAVFAAALGLEERFFAPYVNRPISALRALHYPATKGAAELGQQRAGAHSDYGSLTILLPQVGSRGLEIERPGGGWEEVPTEPGAFVINIGDLMARWTADRWVSTLHRVVAHPGQPARQSLAFFHQPNWDAEIRPLDGSDAYPPVRSGPYLMDKFRATGS